jgi:hypothetical protein
MTTAQQAREVDENYDFFQRHLNDYLAGHRGEYALLKNRTLVGFFAQPVEALDAALGQFADGVFSIQEVTDEPIDLGFFSHVAH